MDKSMVAETNVSQEAVDSRAFVNKMTAKFMEGLTEMLVERGDTFAFSFKLSDVPDWPLRAEVVLAGMASDAEMAIVVLARPQETADQLLEAMNQLREGGVVEVGGEQG